MIVSDNDAGSDDSYRRHRDRAARRAAQASAEGRDIGPMPAIADVDRRRACQADPELFCRVYNRETFTLPWSADQEQAIARIQEAAQLGALYALAMPRGGGKTSVSRTLALWAIVYGLRRFCFLISATQPMAAKALDAIKKLIRFSTAFVADFPEISYPFQKIGGIAQKANGQTSGGDATMAEWGKSQIVLPTVKPPPNWPADWPLRADGNVPTSGAVIMTSGLTGEGIRGSLFTTTTGESLRPDLALIDDFQTPKSAWNPLQCQKRLELISNDVLGLAGPDKRLAAVALCTVIAPGDAADELLDQDKHPLWRGERYKLLPEMPTNLQAWDQYWDVYRGCALQKPPDFTAANAYYLGRRAELEAGAVCSWSDRVLAGDVSALQSAMHIYFRDKRAFLAEYQNTPLARIEDDNPIDPRAIARRLSSVPRGIVAKNFTRLTAFIDVHQMVHYYVVCAWDDAFDGSVIDYGTYPPQNRAYFTLRDAKYTLPLATKVAGLEGYVYEGLRRTCDLILGREWKREDGSAMKIERCMIDANWGTTSTCVKKFCRESPHAAVLLPSHGKGIGASSPAMSDRKPKDGETRGIEAWIQPAPSRGSVRAAIFDANYWKSFTHARLATPAPHGVTLFGDKAETHLMFVDHLCAEKRVHVKAQKSGREVDEWHAPPGVDNHWFDGLVGCHVAAMFLGVRLAELPITKPAQPGKRKTMAEMRAEAARRRGGT